MLDFKDIQELIKLVKRSELSEFNLKNGDFKIEIKYKSKGSEEEGSHYVHVPVQQVQAAPVAHTTAVPTAPPTAPVESKPASNTILIKSPMIGTFYKAPNPDSPSFVSVGDSITEGKTVCVIEAMKLFNEIESEISGKIVKILVEDASPVEYDQPLFEVEP